MANQKLNAKNQKHKIKYTKFWKVDWSETNKINFIQSWTKQSFVRGKRESQFCCQKYTEWNRSKRKKRCLKSSKCWIFPELSTSWRDLKTVAKNTSEENLNCGKNKQAQFFLLRVRRNQRLNYFLKKIQRFWKWRHNIMKSFGRQWLKDD